MDENIFLGREKRGGLFLVDRRRQIEAARAVLAPLDFRARRAKQTPGARATASLLKSMPIASQPLVENASIS